MWHPTRDLSVVCVSFGFRPAVIWKAGDERRTPKGTKIGGIRANSYCVVKFGPTTRKTLSNRIEAALARLRPHRSMLRRLSSTGGTATFSIGWFLDEDAGESLSPKLLQEMAGLRISLDLCVYAPEEETQLTKRR
jgi:hypothetical protein